MPSATDHSLDADAGMNAANADQIRALAQQAKVCGLDQDPTIPNDLRQLIAKANRDQRLLSIGELQRCCEWSGVDCAPLVSLQDHVPELVNQSRSALLSDEPDLVKPGGKLHPQARAEACWRDCFHFLRVSLYGMALRRTEVTDQHGMVALAELYRRLDVPVPALLRALAHLRLHAMQTYAGLSSADQAEALGDTIDQISNTIRHVMKRHEAIPSDETKKPKLSRTN